MEQPELIFLNVLGSAVYGGYKAFRLFRKKKNQLFILLGARRSGITTAISRVKETTESKVLLVDKDDIIDAQPAEQKEQLNELMNAKPEVFGLKFYPLVKDYLKQCRKVYKGVPVVLVVHDETLIKYLNVPTENVLSVLPTISFFNNLVEKYKLEKYEVAIEALTKSRESLIVSHYPKKLIRNWSELEGILTKLITITKK